MTNQTFSNITEAVAYIESLFPSRGSRSHFFSQHISNRGKEAYEFNIKCAISGADWVDSDEYYYQLRSELEDYISDLKEKYSWIKECFTAGRSGGWLVLTTYDRILEDWEDSEFLASEEDVIKRADELHDISHDIFSKITELEEMSTEYAEEYWGYCKPENWDEQVELERISKEKAKRERNEREREVIDYIPSDEFHLIETSHRKWVINDRGDIVSSFDKMKRSDKWCAYGQIPKNNPMVGWNRITAFIEDGIAPRKISLDDAINGTCVRGYSLVVYNSPTGRYQSYGESIHSIRKISKEKLVEYGIKSVA